MSFVRTATPGKQPEPPEEPRERTYVVVGPREVGGKRTGEQVTLSLTDAAEAALIEAGHIERVKEEPQVKEEPATLKVSRAQKKAT